MDQDEGYTAHCGFCDREVFNPVKEPLMCRITITSDDPWESVIHAAYRRVCMDCTVAVITTLGSRQAQK